MAKPETLKDYVIRRGGEISGDIANETFNQQQKDNPGVADRSESKTDQNRDRGWD